MSIVSRYGIEKIKISDYESILLEKKGEDGYSWVDVNFKVNDENIYIGSYYTYDYGMSRGWIKYNNETIAIASKYIPSFCTRDIQVIALFDRKTRLFIEGSKEDLLEYYNQQFGNKKQEENVSFQRKLLIKR